MSGDWRARSAGECSFASRIHATATAPARRRAPDAGRSGLAGICCRHPSVGVIGGRVRGAPERARLGLSGRAGAAHNRRTRLRLPMLEDEPGFWAERVAQSRRRFVTERRYAGTCRDKHIFEESNVGWRLKLDPGVEVFDDALAGRQEQDPSAQCGDFLLGIVSATGPTNVSQRSTMPSGVTRRRSRTGFASSTGRQIRLARLIGRHAPPVFAHHPLIMKSASQKLSKSDGDSGSLTCARPGGARHRSSAVPLRSPV